MQLAAECLQRYAWTYESPGPKARLSSPALAKGSLLHLALAQHYARMREVQQGGDPDSWCDPVEALELIAKRDKAEKFLPLVTTVFEAYKNEYPEDQEEWKILEVEELVSMKVAGKYLLTGRIDLVFEDMGGRIWICDHKSGGRITARHKEYYGISGQLLGYERMSKLKWGDRVAGVMINFLQHGSNPPAFQRITLARRPHLEQRFERSVIDIEESIERMLASGRDFDDWPKAMSELVCFHRYGACAHVDKCRWGKDSKFAGNWTWENL